MAIRCAPPNLPLSPAEAFAAVETELHSIPSRALLHPSLDLRYAARSAMDAAGRLEALHPRLSRLPGFDMRPVLRLGLYACAVWHAHFDLPAAPRDGLTLGHPADGRLPHRLGARSREELRARAYTLLVDAYNHCRRGVTFLRWSQRDVERFLPPLFARRGRWAADTGPASDPWPAMAPPSRALPPSMIDTITAL